MARDCRCPGCDRTPDSGRFCSDRCRVKYDHLKQDAKDARMAAEAEAPRREPDPVSDAEFRRMVL